MDFVQSFYVRPAKNEAVETIVRLQPEDRPALLGTVLFGKKPVQDALVVLCPAGDDGEPDRALRAVYTDERGRFAFGPLEPQQLYQVRIFKAGTAARQLELTE